MSPWISSLEALLPEINQLFADSSNPQTNVVEKQAKLRRNHRIIAK